MPKTISEYLDQLRGTHEHYTVKSALSELGKPLIIWYFYLLYGISIALIPFVLSFYNSYFAINSNDFFSSMWITYLIGLGSIFIHILIYFKYAKFCTPVLAYNHMMEMCMLLCFRGIWWSGVQGWTWSNSPWYLIPILGGFALEWIFYLVVLWARHIRTCTQSNKESNCEYGKGLRAFMVILDFIWAGAQITQFIVGVLFNRQL